MIALSDEREVYVWGRRMGIYSNIELNLEALQQQQMMINKQECNQPAPRQMKNNLIFHKVNRIFANNFNTAIITEEGELLLQGYNDYGQIVLPPGLHNAKEISEVLLFFPEFMKVDQLENYLVKDVCLGSCCVYAICEHKKTKDTRVFGWGSTQFG